MMNKQTSTIDKNTFDERQKVYAKNALIMQQSEVKFINEVEKENESQ
jgi:hypothetical protein